MISGGRIFSNCWESSTLQDEFDGSWFPDIRLLGCFSYGFTKTRLIHNAQF
jgi:hypothetical protein